MIRRFVYRKQIREAILRHPSGKQSKIVAPEELAGKTRMLN